MKTAEDKLAQDLEGADFHDLAFPLVTNVDAKIIQKAEEARDSLKRQVSRPVLWHKSMEVLGQHKIDVCLELGSGKILAGLMKRIARGWPTPPVILSVENWDTLEKARQVISGLL
jgi:[acyl-carrier-protein] S-malonyltransferase